MTQPTIAEALYFDKQISQDFADLRTLSLKIRAAAMAASDAIDNPGKDPVSLADIVADYAEELNGQLDEIEKELHQYSTIKPQ